MSISKINFNLVIVIIYFAFIITTEVFYRDLVYNASLEIQVELSKSEITTFSNIVSIITKAGQKEVLIPIYILLLIFTSLPKSMSLLVNILICYYFQNVMKAIYSNKRPYWEENYNFENFTCNSGYGNPSGHALTSTSIYLGLSTLLAEIEYVRVRPIMKLVISIISFIMITFILFTRFYLLVHSINQIVYGSLLGIGIYYIVYHYLEIHRITNEDLINKFSKVSIKTILEICLILLLEVINFVLYFALDRDNNIIKRLNVICDDKSPLRLVNTDAFFQALGLISALGFYFGLILLFKLLSINSRSSNTKDNDIDMKSNNSINTSDIVNFNNFSKLKYKLISIVIIIPIFIIAYTPWFILSVFDIDNKWANIIFGIAFPFTTFIFLIHSFHIFSVLKIKSKYNII
jgi:membrane-associated phospholipid phosphatase